MTLSHDELSQKKDKEIRDILVLSFEYLLVCTAREYGKAYRISTVGDFNKKNNLSLTKVLLYPFFVSLSNGHSQALYSLFGNFASLSVGPASLSIYDLIASDKGQTFSYFNFHIKAEQQCFTIKVSDTITENLDLENAVDILREKIKETHLQYKNEDCRFSDILILSDKVAKKPIPDAIESGFKALTKLSASFFAMDTDVMKLHASYFPVIHMRNASNLRSVISFKDLPEGKFRPFFLDESE
jgi:hypothetical protein